MQKLWKDTGNNKTNNKSTEATTSSNNGTTEQQQMFFSYSEHEYNPKINKVCILK